MEHTLCLPDNNVTNHQNNYFNVNDYQKPFTYNTSNNYIKSYNVTCQTINNLKALYPLTNASPYSSNIAQSINCYLLKVYITNTIIDYKLFTDAKLLTAYCNNVCSRVKHFAIRYLFLIPEQNYQFTSNQILRQITQSK